MFLTKSITNYQRDRRRNEQTRKRGSSTLHSFKNVRWNVQRVTMFRLVLFQQEKYKKLVYTSQVFKKAPMDFKILSKILIEFTNNIILMAE